MGDRALGQVGRRLYGAKVAVMLHTYKKNINDAIKSPAIWIIEELVNFGADVWIYNPFVPSLATKSRVGRVRGLLCGL